MPERCIMTFSFKFASLSRTCFFSSSSVQQKSSCWCLKTLMMTNVVPQLALKHRTEDWCHHNSAHRLTGFLSFSFLCRLLSFTLFPLFILIMSCLSSSSISSPSFNLHLSLSTLNLTPSLPSIFPHLSPCPPSSAVATLGGGTGCVGGSVVQRSSRRFFIGWSSSWFSSTRWPLLLSITSSLSG